MKIKLNHIFKYISASSFILILVLSFVRNSKSANDKPIVHVLEVESVISPVSAEFITKSIKRAEEADAECVIIELDTPGGLLESTRQITKSFFCKVAYKKSLI